MMKYLQLRGEIATATTQHNAKDRRSDLPLRHLAQYLTFSIFCPLQLHPPDIRNNSAIHHLCSGALSILTTMLSEQSHQTHIQGQNF